MWGWGQRRGKCGGGWKRQPYCHLITTDRQQWVVMDLEKEIIPKKRVRSWHRIGCKTLTVACSWSTVTLASLHLCQGHASCQHITQARAVPGGHKPCKSSTLTSTLLSHEYCSLHNLTQLGIVHTASLNQSWVIPGEGYSLPTICMNLLNFLCHQHSFISIEVIQYYCINIVMQLWKINHHHHNKKTDRKKKFELSVQCICFVEPCNTIYYSEDHWDMTKWYCHNWLNSTIIWQYRNDRPPS